MTQPRRRANEGISAVVKQRSMQRHARHLSSTTSSESSGRRTARDIPRGAVPPRCSGRLTARRGDPTYLVEQSVARLPADAGRARLGRVTTAEESSVGRGEKNHVDALATFKGWAKREGRSVHVKDMALTLLDFIDALLEAKRPVHEADMVVAATGYHNQDYVVRQLMGDGIADKVGQIWGLNEQGELSNMFVPTPQRGLWFLGGGLSQNRVYTRYVALAIKAMELGLVEDRQADDAAS